MFVRNNYNFVLFFLMSPDCYCHRALFRGSTSTEEKTPPNNKHVLWIMVISGGFACLLTVPIMSAIVYDPKKD